MSCWYSTNILSINILILIKNTHAYLRFSPSFAITRYTFKTSDEFSTASFERRALIGCALVKSRRACAIGFSLWRALRLALGRCRASAPLSNLYLRYVFFKSIESVKNATKMYKFAVIWSQWRLSIACNNFSSRKSSSKCKKFELNKYLCLGYFYGEKITTCLVICIF